jgi:hypothetical protein
MAQRTGQRASTLSQAAAGERLPTLPVVLAYVRACGGDAVEWEERWREAASETAAELRPQDEDAEPPYRGLARFEPADADLFFGREQLTDRLLDLTRARRFTAVFGPSAAANPHCCAPTSSPASNTRTRLARGRPLCGSSPPVTTPCTPMSSAWCRWTLTAARG